MASFVHKSGSGEVFAEQMRGTLLSKEFSDVRFVVGEGRKVIHGHRVIIGARCPLLQKLFQESASKPEVPIILADVNPDTFTHMLEFMYTNTVQLSTSSAVDILGTAIEYGLQDLQKVVSEFILQSLDTEFAAEAMHSAVYFEMVDLERRVLHYIADNAGSFFKSKAYLEMGEEAFRKVIESSELDIDESEINKAIFEWGRNREIRSGQPLAESVAKVVRHLRVAIFDVNELESMEQFSAKEGNYIPADMFQFAWKFHAQISSDKKPDISGNEWASLRRGTRNLTHHFSLNPYESQD